MSYAEAAAKGPKQSPEEARAPDVGGVYRDESESTASLVDVDSPHVQAVYSEFLQQDVQTTTQAERIEREEKEHESYEERKAKGKAKAKAKAKAGSVRSNAHNPVYLGNALILGLAGAGLGYGAYRKHAAGQLSWELVGWFSGAVGAFGAVDYFISKWLLQNKYPPK